MPRAFPSPAKRGKVPKADGGNRGWNFKISKPLALFRRHPRTKRAAGLAKMARIINAFQPHPFARNASFSGQGASQGPFCLAETALDDTLRFAACG